MAEDEGSDESLVSRLVSRSDTGLHRESVAGGGEVFKGELARRALRAVGARAMTMDNSIFVDDDFDLSNPDDQALYAHEVHHQMESGGMSEGGNDKHDHEEFAAQAIERMVLHRSINQGHDFGEIMRDVKSTSAEEIAMRSVQAGGGEKGEDPMKAYQAMIAQGKSHHQVVRELAQFVLGSLEESMHENEYRTAGGNFL